MKTTKNSIKAIFIHHSTGADLIKDGEVRKLFAEKSTRISFWDYGYDPERKKGVRLLTAQFQQHIYGLRDETGKLLDQSFNVPGHNTDPDGFAEIFSQPLTSPPKNTLSHLLAFDVIIFKSCFPVTAIRDEEQLSKYKEQYLKIRTRIHEFPTKLFIPMTPPPLRNSLTNRDQAERARQFATWLKSDKYKDSNRNIFVYDFFDALASPSDSSPPNVLRPDFCRLIHLDSHPNSDAHRFIAPNWVEFVVSTSEAFFAKNGT